MDLSIDIFTILNIIGVFQGFFAVFLFLFANKKNKKANIILAILFLIITISISYGIIYFTKLYKYFPHLIRISQPFQLLIAPMFYFYVKFLTIQNYSFKKFDFLHFLPFIAFVIILIPFYLQDGMTKIKFIETIYHDGNKILLPIIIWIIVLCYSVFYIVLIKNILKDYKKQIVNNFSNIKSINLNWLNYAINIFLIMNICFFIIGLLKLMIFQNFNWEKIIPLIATVGIFSLTYKAFILPEIYTNIEDDNKDINEQKYNKSLLKTENIEYNAKKILEYIEKEKPYLDPDLSLVSLSEQINISRNDLSQIINTYFNKNFYDFINSYRIEEFKRILLNPENDKFTILSLAFESGFNSKSTFNDVFKKMTNQTPSQFKKETKIYPKG
ncbi:MAG: hypothetical protein A2Y34_17380 [Spirochaetes bacterium GWC1_27_15]|nr:MAG: hypothetical protein A2Z98_15070 [Spirochaetes bacterium GWB1_27_13]OHD20662.1 MAG: hypothetical protein A2Y34_17380 [Spirochaetes bacterium GWC1_27_15]